MQKPQWFSLRVLALTLALGVLVLSAGLHAIADTTGSWMGQVVYVNNRHIGVKSQAQTRDFLLDANTIFLENGKPAELKDIRTGLTVTVSYSAATLFGSSKALQVEIKSFSLPLPAGT